MDLEPGWEKKALIVLAVITIIVLVYAFNPFKSTPKIEVQNQPIEQPSVATPVPISQPVNPSNTTNNTGANTTGGNGTFQISADAAKQIAANSNSGYTAGEPTQGTVTINNKAVSVWIVPLMKGTVISKKIYVDSITGIIVGSE